MAYEQPRSGTVNQASCVLEHHRVKAEVPAADGRETARHSILATTQIILPLRASVKMSRKLSKQLRALVARGPKKREEFRLPEDEGGRRRRCAPAA